MEKEYKYGPHLTLDMLGCNPNKTSDANFIYSFMKRLVEAVGMNKIGNPHMDLYDGIHSEWGGWSVSIHIQESHMTAHFFDWGYTFLDIFSCKDFDVQATVDWIMTELEADQHNPEFVNPESEESLAAIEFLNGKKSEWAYWKRGKNFPPSLK